MHKQNKLIIAIILCFALMPFSVFAEKTAEEIQAELNEKREQINALEEQIQQKRAETQNLTEKNFDLESYISNLESEIDSLNLDIQKANLELESVRSNIDLTEDKIYELERSIAARTKHIREYVLEIQKNQNKSLLELVLKSDSLADVLKNVVQQNHIQRKIQDEMAKLKEQKNIANEEKQNLEEQKYQLEETSSRINEQRNVAENKQEQKEKLKSANENEISSLNEAIEYTSELKSQLLRQIIVLEQDSKTVSIDDAVSAAKFAGTATGIEPALILAIVDQESSRGRNVGQCTPKYPEVMYEDDYFVLRDIVKDNGLEIDEVKVSCPPTNYQGKGGAIGPGQFRPSTWVGYAPEVSKIMGRTANPWRMDDAMIAVGLKLKANGSGSKIEDTGTDQAVGMYFAGKNWRNHMWYVDSVFAKARLLREYF